MGIHSMGRSSMMQKTSSNRALIKKSEDKRLVKRSVSYATNYSGPGSYRRVQDPSVEHTPSEDAARRDWHQRAVTHAHAHTHKHPQSSSESMTYAYPNRRLSETKGILNRYGGQHAHMHEHSDYSYGGVDFNDNDVDDGFQLSDYTESPANNSPSTATSPSAFKTSTSKEKEKHPKSFNNGEELDSYQSGAEGFRITKSTSVVSLFESIVDSSDAPEGGGDVNSQSELIKFISF